MLEETLTAAEKISHSERSYVDQFLQTAEEIILGKSQELKLMLTCILANGHLLIEDVPGVGKTTFVKTLHALTGLNFNRIQFTNDLLPADILGGQILEPETGTFRFHQGPIFCELLLADEINRATPKTQSACLQAMEESEVSVDGTTHELPAPFFVVATQNPSSNIGTFPLPESQLDRFLMRIKIGFPSREAEKKLLTEESRSDLLKRVRPILPASEIKKLQGIVRKIHVSDAIVEYIQDIIELSRTTQSGLSPRTAIDLVQASKAYAFITGKDFVKPQDVLDVAISVINHRLHFSSGQDGWKAAENLISRVRPR